MVATIQIKIPGDASLLPHGLLVPVTHGLVGYWRVGTDEEHSTMNRLPGGRGHAATVVGAPTYFDGYARCQGGTNYFDLGVKDTAHMTAIVGWRAVPGDTWDTTSADRNGIFGNYDSGTGVQIATIAAGGVLVPGITTAWTAAQTQQFNTETISDWQIMAMITDPTGDKRIAYNLTHDTESVVTETGTRVLGSVNLRLGSTKVAINAPTDVAFCALYDEVLTKDECEKIAAFERDYLSRRSITV